MTRVRVINPVFEGIWVEDRGFKAQEFLGISIFTIRSSKNRGKEREKEQK